MLNDKIIQNKEEIIIETSKVLKNTIKYFVPFNIILMIFFFVNIYKYTELKYTIIFIIFSVFYIMLSVYWKKNREYMLKSYKMKIDKYQISYYDLESTTLLEIPFKTIESINSKVSQDDENDIQIEINIKKGEMFKNKYTKLEKFRYKYDNTTDILKIKIEDITLDRNDFEYLICEINKRMKNI